MIRDVPTGFRIPDAELDFLPIPDPGSMGQKGTGSRIRNTVSNSLIMIVRVTDLD